MLRMLFKWLLGLGVLLALIAAGLWIAGQREHAGRHTGSITIAAPAAEVFPWLVETQRRLQWEEGLESVTPQDELGIAVGAVTRQRVVINDQPNEFDFTLRELFPPHRLVIDSHGEGDIAFDYEMIYELSEADGATTVSLVCDGEYHGGLMRLLEPLIAVTANAKIETDLARLKQLVEAGG